MRISDWSSDLCSSDLGSATTSVSYPEGNSLGLPEGIYLRGLVPVDNELALLLGSEPLEPETTRSYTIGAVWNPTPSFTTTVDLYQIDIDDRILMRSEARRVGKVCVSTCGSRWSAYD